MKKLIIFTTIFLQLNLYAGLRDKTYTNIKVSSVYSVYDGDTFRANIKDYPELLGYRIGIRIKGIDTPEIRAKCKKEKVLALKAKAFAKNILLASNDIELRSPKRGKYFRIVADVYADNKSLAKALISKGLAVEYDGGKKTKNWCE